MDIADLRSYLVIARLANLRAAADVLHQTPSALSKSLKRLEASLGTPLFDRVGKSLRLNAAGELLAARAAELVALADATAAEFKGQVPPRRCRVLGPPVLQAAFAATLASQQAHAGQAAVMDFVACFEDAALTALGRGEADLALVTATALAQAAPAQVTAVHIGEVRMQLGVGPGHPLARRSKVAMAEVLPHDFACVERSPFCGIDRGSRSDGWRDDQYPRRITYWADDLDLLCTLVLQGLCLAYLPDAAFEQRPALRRLTVTDCPFECVEQVHVVSSARSRPPWVGGAGAG